MKIPLDPNTYTSSCSVGLGGSLLGLSDSCLQVDWESSSVLVEAEIVSLAPVHSDAHACMKAEKRCATIRGGGTS